MPEPSVVSLLHLPMMLLPVTSEFTTMVIPTVLIASVIRTQLLLYFPVSYYV